MEHRLETLCREFHITVHVVRRKSRPGWRIVWPESTTHWECTLYAGGVRKASLATDAFLVSDPGGRETPPSVEEVVAHALEEARRGALPFRDFLRTYYAEPLSHQAYHVARREHQIASKMSRRLRRFLGEDLLGRFLDAMPRPPPVRRWTSTPTSVAVIDVAGRVLEQGRALEPGRLLAPGPLGGENGGTP